jgi:hypothetical protein
MVKGFGEYFHGKESWGGFWKISKSESSKVDMNTHKVLEQIGKKHLKHLKSHFLLPLLKIVKGPLTNIFERPIS